MKKRWMALCLILGLIGSTAGAQMTVPRALPPLSGEVVELPAGEGLVQIRLPEGFFLVESGEHNAFDNPKIKSASGLFVKSPAYPEISYFISVSEATAAMQALLNEDISEDWFALIKKLFEGTLGVEVAVEAGVPSLGGVASTHIYEVNGTYHVWYTLIGDTLIATGAGNGSRVVTPEELRLFEEIFILTDAE